MTMTRRLALAGALLLGTSSIALTDNEEAAVNQAIENLPADEHVQRCSQLQLTVCVE